MPYRRKYNKKPYKPKRRYKKRYTKSKSMYSIANRVINSKLESKRFLPLDQGTNIDGCVATSDSRFDQRTLEWQTDALSTDSIAYLKPFVILPTSLTYNPLNQDGDHIISGKSIMPKYLSVKMNIKQQGTAGTIPNSVGPIRICLLKLRNNTTSLPVATSSPTESGKGGLFNRIDTDKYWVLRDKIYQVRNTNTGTESGANIPYEFTLKFFKRLYGTAQYQITSTGDAPTTSVSYPTNGIFFWIFWNRASDRPLINLTYTLGYKDT